MISSLKRKNNNYGQLEQPHIHWYNIRSPNTEGNIITEFCFLLFLKGRFMAISLIAPLILNQRFTNTQKGNCRNNFSFLIDQF